MLMLDVFRKLIWRVSRKLYLWSRFDGDNNPEQNGEYWLLGNVLAQTKAPIPVLFDVGANQGNWTLEALALANAKVVRIEAFEPSSETRQIFSRRVNEIASVAVNDLALSSEPGTASFYSNSAGAGTNSLDSVSGDNVEAVRVSTVDLFMAEKGIETIDFLKIDTEGFDFNVLQGASKALQQGRIDIIQFEYNWRWLINHKSLRDVFAFIADKPYRFGKLSHNRIHLFDDWHFELDRYFENNYVLVHKGSALIPLCRQSHFDASNTH
jgi:FkbM family methyltransferase